MRGESRRRFLAQAAAGVAGVAAMVNTSCSCDCVPKGLELEYTILYGGYFDDKTQSWVVRPDAQRTSEIRDCDEYDKRERARMQQSFTPPPLPPLPTFYPLSPSPGANAVPTRGKPLNAASIPFPPGPVTSFRTTNWISAVAPTNRLVYALDNYSDARVRVLDIQSLAITADLPVPGNTITRGMAMAPDRSVIYLVKRTTPSSSSLLLALDPVRNTFTSLIDLPGPTVQPRTLAISPNGRYAATEISSDATYLAILDLQARRIVGQVALRSTGIANAVFSPDSTLVYTNDLGPLIVDAETATAVARLIVRGANSGPVEISPYGDFLYASNAIYPDNSAAATPARAVAMINTSSLRVDGFIPYSVEGTARNLTSLSSLPGEDILFATFDGEATLARLSPVTQQTSIEISAGAPANLVTTGMVLLNNA